MNKTCFDSVQVHCMDYMDTLPILRDLVICREVSSHDRRGGNDNGFTNKAEFIRKEGFMRRTILDVAGPGCVCSFWFSWLNHPWIPSVVQKTWERMLGQIDVSFGKEDSPRFSDNLCEMIGKDPFTPPFAVHADRSTGGYLSYVPIPFEDGIRVSVEGGGVPMFFHHIWFHTYPMGTQVQDWTGRETVARFAERWNPCIADLPAGPRVHEREDVDLPSHGSCELMTAHKEGTILCIRMKLPECDTALRSVWLQAWWDDDTKPSVEGPLSLFFALENRYSEKPMAIKEHAPLRGLVIGRDLQGFFYFRLPMPFSRHARLVLENRGDEPVRIGKVRIEYDDENRFPGLGKTTGYFRTQFRENRDLVPGRDYVLAHLHGRGHIVGTVLAVRDASETFLEGDERVYTDGCRSPLIAGDATETYFGGSWYFFEKAFSCPLHGAPTFRMASKKIGSTAEVTMYRFHLTDFIPFRSEARFSIQHGPFNNVPGHYRSLVFYYGLPRKSVSRTDFLRLCVRQDLEAHGYKGTEPVRTRERRGFFEGEFNGQDLGLRKKPGFLSPVGWMFLLTARGIFHDPPKESPHRRGFTVCEHNAPYTFTVRVDPESSAVMLRRLFDQSVPDQQARIEVDGETAGTWFNPGRNKWKIWAEDDLILDPRLTAGKRSLRIRVVPLSSVFSAVEYKVFSIVTPEDENHPYAA